MENKKKRLWYLFFAVLTIGVYFLTANIMQLLAYQVIPQWIHFQPTDQKAILLYLDIADIVISIILLLLVLMVYKKVGNNVKEEKVKLNKNGVLTCITCGMAIAGIVFLISLLFFTNDYAKENTLTTEKLIMTLLTSVLFAPMIEELLFRGIVYRLLSGFRKGWFAIMLSAFIFAVYHWDVMQGILTFIMGIILAFTYWKTNNIKYPILIHAVNNAFVVIVGSVLPLSVRPVLNWISVGMVVVTAGMYFLKREK